MKPTLDLKAKKLALIKRRNDLLQAIKEEEQSLRAVASKGQQILKAREFYAACKIQSIVRGFLDRVSCRNKRQYMRAIALIQRIMKGKLGRLRWMREYWRSVSVVRSDTALKELLLRSSKLRDASAAGRNGYHWTEYFDSLTDSFWYYNSKTKHNTWNCPLPFQTHLVCPWNGFLDFGGLPAGKKKEEQCRCVFPNLQAYQNHLRSAHAWYCVACHQRNTGLNFPVCFVCGNKFNVDGLPGEIVLRDAMHRVRSQLETFVHRDVSEKERKLYSVRDRLLGLANERENVREAMAQLKLEMESREASGELTAAQKERGQRLLLQINENYLDRTVNSNGSTVSMEASVLQHMATNFFNDESNAQNKLRKQTKVYMEKKGVNIAMTSNSHSSTALVAFDNYPPTQRSDNNSKYDNYITGSMVPIDPEFAAQFAQEEDINSKSRAKYDYYQVHIDDSYVSDSSSNHRTVSLSVQQQREQQLGGAEGDRQRFRHASTRGVFNATDFTMFMNIHNDDIYSNLALNLYDSDSDEEENDKLENQLRRTMTASYSRDDGDIRLQKLLVCEKFLAGQCSLSTCPLAHPGLRDNCRMKMKSVRGSAGEKRKAPFVFICPHADDGISNSCPDRMNCRLYHVYCRPSTAEIIRMMYPKVSGRRTKVFSGGAKIDGNTAHKLFHGYGVMTWRDGSTYMGDWKENKKDGCGIFRSSDGTEFVGTFRRGLRHGWGVLVNTNGDEYIGQFVNGKMEGVGRLTSQNGDVYEGNFVNNLYEGVGMFSTATGDVFMGNCRVGLAHGLGVMSFASGERYKGNFERNNRHGKGACAYPNGARYVGEWFYGVHQGFGIFLSPIGEKYVGQWAGGKKHGKGRYTFRNGDFYDGDFHKDKAHGVGVYHHANGNVYSGQWADDKRNGKGTYVFANGSKYTGHWLNNDIHHKGRFDFATGAYYRGQFVKNVKHGKGIYTWPNGNIYSGDFVEERLCGTGDMKYVRGHRYIGAWRDNKKNGRGVFYYSNGSVYEGDFVDDIRQGKGKITYSPNSPVEESYEGDWDNDERTGHGVYKYRKDEGTVYEGDWVKGVREGHGKLAFKDGSFYRGDFKEDKMWGRGVYIGADSSQYDGDWRKNMRQGVGTALSDDGSIYHGEFWGNMRQGKGRVTRPDGSVYEGTWEANFIIGTGKITIPVGNKEKKDGLPKQVTMKVFSY